MLSTLPETLRALAAVAEERQRQRDRHGRQILPNGTARPGDKRRRRRLQRACDRATAAGRLTWRAILCEEVAEALAESNPAALRAELLQVAAVAVQWAEALDT